MWLLPPSRATRPGAASPGAGQGRTPAINPSQGWLERQPPASPASPRPRPASPRRCPRRVRSASPAQPKSPRDMCRACGRKCGGVLDWLRPPAGAGRCLERRGLCAIDAFASCPRGRPCCACGGAATTRGSWSGRPSGLARPRGGAPSRRGSRPGGCAGRWAASIRVVRQQSIHQGGAPAINPSQGWLERQPPASPARPRPRPA